MPNEHSCFYAAIGLTSQGDCHALTQHMLDLVESLTFVERASVYDVYARGENKEGSPLYSFLRFTDRPSDDRRQPEEVGLAECATRKSPVEVSLEAPNTRLVFPIESETGPFRLLSLEGSEISPQERVLLLNLVTLYRNQVSVLDSKERDSLTGLLNRQTFELRLMQLTELRKKMAAEPGWVRSILIISSALTTPTGI